jgi:hypothetical protein
MYPDFGSRNVFDNEAFPLPDTLHSRLTALLARIDQQIAEAEAIVHNANMPAEDWFR